MKYMRGNIAEDFFKRGFNCSQAVVLAYNDYIQMEGVQLLKFTLPLGAGLGRLRLTCGAVVGMAIVCGYIVGKNDPSDENKNRVYEAVREVVHRFEEKYTTITCKELLESKDVIAKIEESILKSMKLDFMDSEDRVNDFLNERLIAPEKVPKSIFKSINLYGIQVFPFGDKNAKNMIII